MKILAVTACPTGIAHTFMAAEAIEQAAKAKGYDVKVETRGSIGIENELTADDIKNADAIVLACDTAVPMERFAGKKVLSVSVSDALKDAGALIERALKANVYKTGNKVEEPTQAKEKKSGEKSGESKGFYKHLMNGVSFMIPFVVAGGIAIALSFIFGIEASGVEGTLPAYLDAMGGAAFGLMVPILAGYISFSIADRPGLAPGMIGGVIANQIGAGFLGGLVAGFLAGYIVQLIKKYVKLPKSLQGIMPVLIIPVFGSILTGLLLYYVFGKPVALVNVGMNNFLLNMSGTNAVILGLLVGLMMAFDMGGPVNKAAYAFGTGTLLSGASSIMAAVMAAGMVPPLALALATVLFKNKFTAAEKEAGKAAWILGASFITEGAIPFAAADPFRVIPAMMVGSAATGALVMLFGSTLSVPHGGLFVFFAITNLPAYLLAIAIGTIISAFAVGFLKQSIE